MNKQELQHYLDVVIPNIEGELASGNLEGQDLLDVYTLYLDVLKLVGRDDFATFNKFLEIDEDHNDPNSAFFHHRREHLATLVQALNDMEIHDKYDMLLISMPPRRGRES